MDSYPYLGRENGFKKRSKATTPTFWFQRFFYDICFSLLLLVTIVTKLVLRAHYINLIFMCLIIDKTRVSLPVVFCKFFCFLLESS